LSETKTKELFKGRYDMLLIWGLIDLPCRPTNFLPTAPPLILLDYLRPPWTTGIGQLHYSLMESYWNFYSVENLIEYRPEQVCKDIAQESGLLTWLVKKLKVKVPFDNNKLYASGVTSISFSLTFVYNNKQKSISERLRGARASVTFQRK